LYGIMAGDEVDRDAEYMRRREEEGVDEWE
jgi:hypothetical protein